MFILRCCGCYLLTSSLCHRAFIALPRSPLQVTASVTVAVVVTVTIAVAVNVIITVAFTVTVTLTVAVTVTSQSPLWRLKECRSQVLVTQRRTCERDT